MGVENVVSLVPSDIIEKEQVEADEDVGETSTRDFDQIEMDLEKTIDGRGARKCSYYYSIVGARKFK